MKTGEQARRGGFETEMTWNNSHKIRLSDFNDRKLPRLPDELIGGILRKRRKMLLAGPSKAAKTGLLMELALALASGGSWLGFPCAKAGCCILTWKTTKPPVLTVFLRSAAI